LEIAIPIAVTPAPFASAFSAFWSASPISSFWLF
jgi:hypothetical protein